MTIELPRELEAQLNAAARAEGVSVPEYIEKLVAETTIRNAQICEFRTAMAERMASLNAGESMNGEEVMSRLIDELR